MASAVLNVCELVDLAIGVPDVNAISIELLQAVFHIILTKFGISQLKVEFEGQDAKRIKKMKEEAKPNMTKFLNYSIVEPTENEDAFKNEQKQIKDKMKQFEFQRLENKVRLLTTHVEALTMLPAADEMIEKLRVQPDATPVLEMLHNVALTKRVSALEEENNKMASLIELMIREQNKVRSVIIKNFPDSKLDAIECDKENTFVDTLAHGDLSSKPEIKQIIMTQDKIQEIIHKILQTLEGYNIDETLAAIISDIQALKEKAATPGTELRGMPSDEQSTMFEGMDKKIYVLEKACHNNDAKIKNFEQNIRRDLNSLEEQFKGLESDLSSVVDKIQEQILDNLSYQGKRSLSGQDNMTDLGGTIGMLHQELDLLSTNLQTLIMDHDRKNEIIKKLRTAIERLENTKLDKDFVDDLLACKADTVLVNRKVSYEQFDQTCYELNGVVNNALKKIDEQENQWASAIGEINNLMKNKIDKGELSPIKDFINHKLKELQDRLKTLMAEKTEFEAAGSKKKLFKDVDCISCNKPVIQKVDKDSYKDINAFPATKSVRSYLTYELDQIRKQQRQLPMTRNLNELIKVTVDVTKKERGGENRKMDLLCTRYCGGSHTLTTPEQRVSRIGHFSDQWGIQFLPVGEEEDQEENEPNLVKDILLPKTQTPHCSSVPTEVTSA
ncbi:uncharacterized protein LOC142330678 [Lycorma delicatula]|uniref:uncharacterized protein LOC142330678 n=1 Tax=Lycorma delicatula TaxID=130591 RepID=UPI003F518B4C